MGSFTRAFLIVVAFLNLLFISWVLAWHYGAFKYVFQFVASAGVMLIGLIYLVAGVRVSPPARVALGLVFVLVLPVAVFFLSDVLLFGQGNRLSARSAEAVTAVLTARIIPTSNSPVRWLPAWLAAGLTFLFANVCATVIWAQDNDRKVFAVANAFALLISVLILVAAANAVGVFG